MAATASVVAAVATTASAVSSISKGSGSKSTQAASDASGQAAADYRQKVSDLWSALQTPNLNRTDLVGQRWLGDYVPETYTPYEGQVTQMSDSPEMIARQNAAMDQLQQLAKGGLTPSDLINLQQIQRSQAGSATSQSQAAIDALRARGLGGSGAELATRLAGNQFADNQSSNLYDNAMKAAMDRQVAAINSGGNMATNVRAQDADISNKMAQINNTFNQQIQQLRTGAAQSAANVRNAAQVANLSGRQGIANSDVNTYNSNVALQNQLAQQDYNNQSSKIAGQGNALLGQSQLASAQQAALGQRALGQDQSLTAGLNGLGGVAKSFTGNSSSNGSSSGGGSNGGSNWMSDLFSSGPNDQFDIPQSSTDEALADSWV